MLKAGSSSIKGVFVPAPGKLELDSLMLSMQESLAYIIKETVKLSTI